MVVGGDPSRSCSPGSARWPPAPRPARRERRPLRRRCSCSRVRGRSGSGWLRSCLGRHSVFAERMAECAAALESFVDWSLLDVLGDAEALERVDVVQPALFAVMVSLAEVWRSYGVEPAAVVGHSQGEIAAAVVAGGLSLEDGARVVALRSKAIAKVLAGRGGMVSVALPAAEVRERLAVFGESVSVAAVNGPSSTVVSGTPEALDDWLAAGRRRACGPVGSRWTTPRTPRRWRTCGSRSWPTSPRLSRWPPPVPLFSTVTGEWLDAALMDADYWYRNLRQTVRFEEAVRALAEQGFGAFIECSAHPVLTVGVQETAGRRRGGRLAAPRRRWRPADADLAGRGVRPRRAGGLGGAVRRGARGWTCRPTPSSAAVLVGPRPETERVAVQGGSPADAAFWQAVESEDLGALADTLQLDGESLTEVLPALTSWRQRQVLASTVDAWRYRVEWTPTATTSSPVLTGCLAAARHGRGDRRRERRLRPPEHPGARRRRRPGGGRAGLRAGRGGGFTARRPARRRPRRSRLAAPPRGHRPHTRHGGGRRGERAPGPRRRRRPGATLVPDQWRRVHRHRGPGGQSHPGDRLGTRPGRHAGTARPLGRPDRPARRADGRAATRLAAVLAGETEEEVAIRATGVLVRRLVHAPAEPGGRRGAEPRHGPGDRRDRRPRGARRPLAGPRRNPAHPAAQPARPGRSGGRRAGSGTRRRPAPA